MGYFQFDVIKSVSEFFLRERWSRDDSTKIRQATGLAFAAPKSHSPWRNYLRVFKLCLLVSEENGLAIPTALAKALANEGKVSCDEFLHFLARATTDPSPALSGWGSLQKNKAPRFPLCFALKYILARFSVLNERTTPFREIVSSYIESRLDGREGSAEFAKLALRRATKKNQESAEGFRQSLESLRFLTQLSYLHGERDIVVVSQSREESLGIIESLAPFPGPYLPDGNQEIQRMAEFILGILENPVDISRSLDFAIHPEESFIEGGRIMRAHFAIERNFGLRRYFFECHPTSVCDACCVDTHKSYPWVERVLDLHHILPLSSGTRASAKHGTVLEDLVPVCPTCHRAIHRFYKIHLNSLSRQDFLDPAEARDIYFKAKAEIQCSTNQKLK